MRFKLRGLVLVIVLIASGAAAEPRLKLAASAAPEAVFLHARDACERSDVPDVAARAWRDATGKVSLVASHSTNRRMVGPGLDQLKQDCAVIYKGGGRDAPEAHDDRSWLTAFYTLDGRTVHALAHNEFHGQRRPALCPAGVYKQCWRNSVTAALSGDGGASFQRREGGDALVAGPPYRYRGDEGRPTGLFGPSNIFARDGYYYTFIWAEGFDAQKRGACLLRTNRLDDPKSWRAFDGSGFTIRFADPYHEAVADPSGHVCTPIAPQALISSVRSVVWHVGSQRWIAMLSMWRRTGGDANPTVGIWWTTSTDLIQWTEPRLLWAVPLLTRLDCDQPAAFYYPALLDPASDSRNFETIGDRPYLYLTRLNLENCRVTWNRDLVRLPVRVSAH